MSDKAGELQAVSLQERVEPLRLLIEKEGKSRTPDVK